MISLPDRVRRLKKPRLLLVGDLILDHYVSGEVRRISPEAPIPVLEVKGEEHRLGGVGNVAANVVAMGGEAVVAAVLGEDPNGRRLREKLREAGIGDAGVAVDRGRPTTIKTRHVSQVHQMLRVDWENRALVSGKVLGDFQRRVIRLLPEADLVILSDYAKGALAGPLIETTIREARKRRLRILVDPKGSDFHRYRGASLVTPNRAEAEAASGIAIEEEIDLTRAGKKLIRELDLEAAVITLGKEGIFFITRTGEELHIPTEARAVFDVTGAGDTVIAHLGLFLAQGASLEEAVRLANIAAGIVVGKFGTGTVTKEELLGHLEGGERGQGKILDSGGLDRVLAELRREERRIVFTNGCFDLLHAGHVDYLQKARSYGDCLIVGVNDDASVRRLKGMGRPLQPLAHRMAILAGLQSVTYVVPFAADTPHDLIRQVGPHVLVKGEDWKGRGVVGQDWVESHGGLVVLAKFLPGCSTSGLIQKVVSRCGPRKRSYAKSR